MFQYITVFDPSRSSSEDNIDKQLLLYHSFVEVDNTTLNEKLSQIGIIQGIWTFASSIDNKEKSSNPLENVIELEDHTIFVLKLESTFFMALSVITNGNSSIPNPVFLGHMWYCYQFFVLQYGMLDSFQSSEHLTASLNEHVIPFWTNLMLKPEVLLRKGLTSLYPHNFKNAEIESTEKRWETIIESELLPTDGIKDILVYHLPCGQQDKTDQNNQSSKPLAASVYGFVRNFNNTLRSLPELSNWIYHLHALYDRLSSHQIVGNVHYEQVPDTDELDKDRPVEDNAWSFTNRTKSLLHNLALPISFARDTVQEVGTTTDVARSLSFLTSYLPSWPQAKDTDNHLTKHLHSRAGFLISPLCSEVLPLEYKVKQLHLRFGEDKPRVYNALFWYFDEVLVAIICNKDFDQIWSLEYLQVLHDRLFNSISLFYQSAFTESTDCNRGSINFAYLLVDKNRSSLKTSIPSWWNKSSITEDVSALQLIINGVDQVWSNSMPTENFPNMGLDIMGRFLGLVGNKDNKVHSDVHTTCYKSPTNFLDKMSGEKVWELHLEIINFLQSFEAATSRDGIIRERLLRLNNGVMCYIKEDGDNILVVVKNWFEDESKTRRKETLFDSLGFDVKKWWQEQA